MEKRQDADSMGRYAIIQTGGKQYQAIEGKTLGIEKIDAKEGDSVTFEALLRRTDADSIEIGTPILATPVKATIVKHLRGPKITVFKFKRRKKYMRKKGHRQPVTVVRIVSI